MANESKMYWGTASTVISLAATLASGANTYVGLTGCTTTDFDNSSNYPYAVALLDIIDTFAAAPGVDAYVALYLIRNNIDGTVDHLPVPIASDIKNAEYAGRFLIENTDEAQRVGIGISLDGIRNATFFIQNQTGQNISYTSNPTTVKIIPYSIGPT